MNISLKLIKALKVSAKYLRCCANSLLQTFGHFLENIKNLATEIFHEIKMKKTLFKMTGIMEILYLEGSRNRKLNVSKHCVKSFVNEDGSTNAQNNRHSFSDRVSTCYFLAKIYSLNPKE